MLPLLWVMVASTMTSHDSALTSIRFGRDIWFCRTLAMQTPFSSARACFADRMQDEVDVSLGDRFRL